MNLVDDAEDHPQAAMCTARAPVVSGVENRSEFESTSSAPSIPLGSPTAHPVLDITDSCWATTESQGEQAIRLASQADRRSPQRVEEDHASRGSPQV